MKKRKVSGSVGSSIWVKITGNNLTTEQAKIRQPKPTREGRANSLPSFEKCMRGWGGAGGGVDDL